MHYMGRTAKLSPHLYGLYKLLEQLGLVSYYLQLPLESKFYPVFHFYVSSLKQSRVNHNDSESLPNAHWSRCNTSNSWKTRNSRTVSWLCLAATEIFCKMGRSRWARCSLGELFELLSILCYLFYFVFPSSNVISDNNSISYLCIR